MKELNLNVLIILFFLSLNSIAFECKPGQRYVSRFDPNRQLSEEEIDGRYEYLDVVSHMEGEIDGVKYSLNKSMELYKHSGKTKEKILKFNSNMSGDNTSVSVFKFGNYQFFEIGINDYMEGYMSNVHVVDLKSKEVLSELNKCANNNEFFGLKKGVLTYMCEWYCEKNEYFTFDPQKKKFITVNKKHNCGKKALPNKLVGIKQSHFKTRYKKDKNGVEYKSSRLPLTENNCN